MDVMVIGVHPDDETLGCGGTLLKYKAAGDRIHWVICTQTDEGGDFFSTRETEIKKVTEKYSFDSVHKLKLQTTKVDEYSMSDLIGRFSNVINKVKPEVLFLPFHKDVHSDHRKVFEAAYSCTKSFRYSFLKEIFMMEVLSETEFAPSLPSESFIPNVFVDITDYFEKKMKIMEVFESEIAGHPFPRSRRSIEALALYRGSTSGVKYAESFMLLKSIR